LIAAATLTPQLGSSNMGQGFFAALPPQLLGPDAIRNVLLYVPFGAIAGWTGVRWLHTTLAATFLSLLTELLQFLVPGRDPVVTDIVWNTLGAALAWRFAVSRRGASACMGLVALERCIALSVRPGPRRAAKLSLFWALIVSSVIVISSWLLTPLLPEPHYFLVGTPLLDPDSGPLTIGSEPEGQASFNGLIDEVRVYSAARSAEAIRIDMNTPVSAATSTPDLVAAFGFDSNRSGLATNSTNGPPADVRRAQWTASGRFGGALAFDGHSSAALVPYSHALDLRREMTIEAWVNPSRNQASLATVVAHAGSYFLRASSRSGALAPSAGGTFGAHVKAARSRIRIPANAWTHLAAVYDGRSMVLYIDSRPTVRMRHWSNHVARRFVLNGDVLSSGLLREPGRIHSHLTGGLDLSIDLECGVLEREAASAFSLVGVQSIEVMNIDTAGTELRFRWYSRGRWAGFAPVEYRVPDALSGCQPGEELSFTVTGPIQDPRFTRSNGVVMQGYGPGAGTAWAYLLDSRVVPAWLVPRLSVGFLALLVVPFGYWARLSPRTLIGVSLLAGALFAAPEAFGTLRVDRVQTAGCVAGLLAGVMVRIATTSPSARAPS
jgi:hypothetical protein